VRLTSATLAALILTGAAAAAATPLTTVRYAPDITVVLGGTTVNHNQVAEDDLAGSVSLINVGAIPATAEITAYDRLPNGDQLLALDTTVTLPGGLTVRPGDVVRFNGTTYTLEFDASAAGLPNGVITDAASEIGPNDLLLSFDVTVAFGSITADDEDLVRVHNGVVSLFFDGSANGVAAGLDLDAVHCLDSNGHVLLSFDGSGTVGSNVNFGPADVLEFDPSTGNWALSYDGVVQHSGWVGGNLHGLAATTNPPPTSVVPSINVAPGNSAAGGGGLGLGTKRVFGIGMVHAKTGDTCISIYAVGPNGSPDAPPGSVDDELLGSGGTDASGNFVDASDAAGIPLSRGLNTSDRIFAADVCEGFIGAVVGVVAPAPTLSAAGLVLLVAALVLLGLRGLTPRRPPT
jgi:hypothetical protein